MCLLLLLLAPHSRANCASTSPLVWGELKYVVDGDTLHLKDGRKLRLIGVNTPELGHNGRPDQPLALEARRLVERFFAADKRVGLQVGAEPRDHYGRQLVHIYRSDGEALSAQLLEAGLAWRVAVPPNLAQQDCLAEHERRARASARGVWSEPVYQAKPSADLTAADGGFGLVSGRVEHVTQTAKGWWIDLEGLSLRLPRDKLVYFGKNLPDSWLRRQVIVRGWIIDRSGTAAVKKRGYAPFLIQLQHPSMIEFATPAQHISQ